MKIDLTKTILQIDGKPFQKAIDEKTKVDLRLADVAIEALARLDERMSGEDKFKQWQLATKIHENASGVDLTFDEIVLIKNLIGKIFAPMIVGQAWQILEQKDDKRSDA